MQDQTEVQYLSRQDIQDQIDTAGYAIKITELDFFDVSYLNNISGQIIPSIAEWFWKKSIKLNVSFFLATLTAQFLLEENKKALTNMLIGMKGHDGIKVTLFYKYDGYKPGSSNISYSFYKMNFEYY